MKNFRMTTMTCAVAAVLAGTTVYAAATGETVNPLNNETVNPLNKVIKPLARPLRPAPVIVPQRAAAPIPREETTLAASNSGFATPSAFSATAAAAAPAAQSLSGPVTLSYSGSSNAFSLTQSGTGRGLSASVTNTNDVDSALYGDTTGAGAGLTGYNLGTVGPGGKFEVTNANSAQAGAFASTNGTGPGLLATITNTKSNYPAILGQSTAGAAYGIGIIGEGNNTGVMGIVPASSSAVSPAGVTGESFATTANALNNYGVYGNTTGGNGIGVAGVAGSGYGVYASSSSNYAVYAVSGTGYAIYAEADGDSSVAVYGTTTVGVALGGVATDSGGQGVQGDSAGGTGVLGIDSTSGIGVQGNSSSGDGVYGYSNSGTGVYGGSGTTGTAGFFAGNVTMTGTLTVGSTTYSSDKNLKTDVRQIDGKDLLDRLSQLPISSWTYKSDTQKRHIGPMAQDFHAAFALNGSDETHISEVDVAGVSLAAIKQLDCEMKAKDAEVAELRTARNAQTAKIAELTTKLTAQTQTVAKMQQQFAALTAALQELKEKRVAANR